MDVVTYSPEDYASVSTRATAFIVDLLIFSPVTALLVMLLKTPAIVLAVILFGLYDLTMHCLLGATAGKLLLGCRITSLSGEELTFWQSLVRTISKTLSVIPLGLGLLWGASASERRQAWHDRIAGTYAVLKSAQPVGSEPIEQKSAVKSGLFLLTFGTLSSMGLGVLLLAYLYSSFMQIYRVAEAYAVASEEVRRVVGEPVKARLATFNMHTDGNLRFLDLRIRLSGPNGKLLAEIQLAKRDSSWVIRSAHAFDRQRTDYDLIGLGRASEQLLLHNAQSLYMTTQTDSALAIADSVLQNDPENAEALSLRGNCLWVKGDVKNGIYEMTHSLMVQSWQPMTQLSRGLAYLDDHQYDMALMDFDNLLANRIRWPLVYKGEAIAYDSLGMSARALVAYGQYVDHELDTAYSAKNQALERMEFLRLKVDRDQKGK